jgi:flagellar assembly protein FliH
MTKPQHPTDAETDQTQPGQTAGAEPDDLTAVDVDDAAVMALLKGLDEEGDIPSGPAFLDEDMPDASMTPAQLAAIAAARLPQSDDAAMLMSAPPPPPARAPRRPRPSKLEATEAVADVPVEETDEEMVSFASAETDDSAAVDYADTALEDASEQLLNATDDYAEPAAYDDIDAGAVEDVAEPMAAPGASMSMDMFEEEEPKNNSRAMPVYDANVKRFMFERDFEAELRPAPPKPQEPVPEQPTEVLQPDAPVHPPSPMFSAEELHAARMAAYADGETTGLQTAMGSIDSKIARALEQIGAQLPSLQHDREQVVHSVSEEAARLAHAMVARMFPELARRYGLTEIQAVIADCIEQAIDQPRIIIRLHPDLAPFISEKAEHMAMMAGYAGRLSVLPETTLGPSDIRLEWGDGGAERLISRAWADISDIVGRAVTHLAETVPSDQDSGLSAA